MESSRELLDDGRRQMRLCNACRYCEGYCAVWQAIEWRRDFDDNDMKYLANLCHDCGDCYYACPFTAPHEFNINPPRLFAKLREKTYQQYAWPSSWGRAISKKVTGFWISFILSSLIFFGYIFASGSGSDLWQVYTGENAFYALIPKNLMVAVFVILSFWMVGIWFIGAVRYWRDIRISENERILLKDILTATKYAMSLRFLGGEGEGCTYPDDKPSTNRKWLHHLVLYGFLLDFASTSLASFYDNILDIPAPYPVLHPVVILGIVGGVGMIIGTSGLLYLNFKRDSELEDQQASKSGVSFIMSLWMIAVTGMVLLIFRETAAMYTLLILHLGSVAAFFFTAPYTKFAHFVYRFLSLVNYAQEERQVKEREKTA